MDVARHVGGKVQEKFGWGVKMKNFDIEYVINVDDNQAYAGIGKKKKTRETLFTFKLHNAKLLSFWRDFHRKIQNCNFEFIEKIPWNFVYIYTT